jgi:hypothetical protein
MSKRPAAFFLKENDWPPSTKIPLSDLALWLDNDPRRRSLTDPWLDAFRAIDKNENKAPLIALLKSECDLPRGARVYLADLIERKLKLIPKNRPRTPAYDLSDTEAHLILAKEEVREYRASGMNFDDAVAKVAKERSLSTNKLENFCKGKRGSSNRGKKRLRSALKS